MSDRLAKAISVLSGALIFGIAMAVIGFSVGSAKLWPYQQIVEGARIVRALLTQGSVPGEGRQHPAPPGTSRSFAAILDPDAAIGSGYYALYAWDSDRSAYSVFLHDATGTRLHTWPVDEMQLTDKARDHENAPHAFSVLRDGSVVVSFDYLGVMARLGPCGQTIWSREGFFHHSFNATDDGGIWTWYSGDITAFGQHQTMLEFDAETGADRRSLDLVDVINRTPASAILFSTRQNAALQDDRPLEDGYDFAYDIFHPNDVEELSAALAPAFPMFAAGDLLLSIRELDLVLVISPEGDIKWSARGPWLRQHDPDFEPDGTIAVYDNRLYRPSSTILSIDPGTGEVRDLLADYVGPFNSDARGKHQLLPNGNRLVVSAEQGWVFEVTPDGRVVAEFNNVVPSDPSLNDDITNAIWLPEDYFDTVPSCSG